MAQVKRVLDPIFQGEDKKTERTKKTLSHRKYKKENPAKMNSLSNKRRASKLGATPFWLTKAHHAEIESMYASSLKMRELTGHEYHVDHIVPLQGKNVSGLHVPWNLQVIRAEDNLKKSNKLEQATA